MTISDLGSIGEARSGSPRRPSHPGGIVLVLVTQILNSLGVWIDPTPGPFFCGLVFVLFVSAYAFARMVFIRPNRWAVAGDAQTDLSVHGGIRQGGLRRVNLGG